MLLNVSASTTGPTTGVPPRRRQTQAQAIAVVVRRDMPALLTRVTERICAEIPFYAAQAVVPVAELHRSVTENVDWMLDGLVDDTTPDLRAPQATGRARAAQGAPLADVLSAYRIGFSELWTALVSAARSLRTVPDAEVVTLAGAVFALHNAYGDAVITSYREEAAQIVRARERERAVLVEALLGGTTSSGSLWEVADALRLPLTGAFVVVAAETELGRDPLPRAESALAVLDVRSVWRLQADFLFGLVHLPDRARNDAVVHVLQRQATGRVGMSPVFGELGLASWALRLARLALGRRGEAGVTQYRDSPLGVLVAAAPHAALDAARAVLGELLELPAEDRDLLLGTFDAWIEGRGSAKDAAAALFCHPNTVRYRLRRIETITGRGLDDPAQLAELVTATRAWAQLPHDD